MLAGISKMDTKRFTKLNFFGAVLWIGVFMFSGYLLGNVPLVKENLETTVLLIVVFTTLLLPVEILRDRLANRFSKSRR
jgi:membrane-associated protein